MAPTVHELQDLFWRAFWTFVSAFIGGVAAVQTFDAVEYKHAAFAAGMSVLTNVLLVYARQKAPGTGINAGPPSAPQMPRGDSK